MKKKRRFKQDLEPTQFQDFHGAEEDWHLMMNLIPNQI